MNLTQQQKLEIWNTEESKIYIVNNFFLLLYIIIAVFGNSLVIIVYKTKMKEKTDDRYFIPWLALLDILACITRCALELAKNFKPVDFRNTIVCKLCWIPINITAFSSLFLLIVIAVQRYLKVCRPHGKQMTPFWKRIALGLTITVSFGVAMVLNVYNETIAVYNDELNVTGYVCDININNLDSGFITFIFFASVFILVIMLVLFILNILIWRTIRSQLRFRMTFSRVGYNLRGKTGDPKSAGQKWSSMGQIVIENNQVKPLSFRKLTQADNLPSDTNIRKNYQEKMSCKFSYMFMLIAVAFVLSYIPQFVVLFISVGSNNVWSHTDKTKVAMFAFLRELNVVNNLVNPLIYGYYDKRFRESTIDLLKANRITIKTRQTNYIDQEVRF